MHAAKYLFLVGFPIPLLIGCATHTPPAAVIEVSARPAPAVMAASAPVANAAANAAVNAAARKALPPTRGTRSPEMLFQALATAGFDYQRGGKSMTSGFDCSGLVAHVFRQAYGVQLPHNAKAQSGYGTPVAVAQLEAGDLVFFNTERQPFSHVGIYLGDNRFIHAPKPGAVVRTENMQLNYWRSRFDGARRIID